MSVIRGGYDAHVDLAHPNATHQKANALKILFGNIRGLLYMPLASILGQTVITAQLTGHVGPGGLPAGTVLTFTPLAESWSAAEATWANQPALGTGAATFTTLGGLAAGAEFAVNVTTAVQSVSTGNPWYGWRITASTGAGTVQVVAFNSAAVAWTLTVEISDLPGQPTMLTPNGGVVGLSRPTLTWDYAELGATGGQATARVQLDPAADGVSPNFDSGILSAHKDPQLDLTTTAYAALAANASDQWRVQTLSESGVWSPWSDWAPFTYVPKPSVTLLSPAAGVLWDATAEILAAVSPATMEAYAVRVTSGTDRTDLLYDSRKQPASDPALVGAELPATGEGGSRILVDDRDYQLNVRVFDNQDRQATPGDPTYVDVWTTFHFDDDLALTPCATTSAHQVGHTPNVRITWTRASAADKWIVLRDDLIVATLLPEDTVSGVSTYSWVDSTATPNVRHVYTVKAVVNDRQTAPGPHGIVTPQVEGIWWVSAHGNVRIDGTDVDGFRRRDKRATYKLLRGPDVDIIHGFEGVSVDSFTGSIENEPDQSFEAAKAVLDAIYLDPTTPLRQVYGSKNIRIQWRNLSVDPASDMLPEDMRHNVTFGFWEV